MNDKIHGSIDMGDWTRFQEMAEKGYADACAFVTQGEAMFFSTDGGFTGIHSTDRQSGLPIISRGRSYLTVENPYCRGFNARVFEYLKREGTPWNSRRQWLVELSDIAGYFEERRTRETPLALADGAAPLAFNEVLLRAVEDRAANDSCWRHVEIASPRTYQGRLSTNPRCVRRLSNWYYRWDSWPIESSAWRDPTERSDLVPPVGPGVQRVWLRWYQKATKIEFFWGPAGSELAFFKFTGSGIDEGRRYVALDLQLGDWVPSQVTDFPRQREPQGQTVVLPLPSAR